ncbi:hypothetical protein [Tenacibaculum sp. 190524A02b]|uniref:hypothetical protein n=1 Tax=Tenacibaculum vairaonense TaxID=3137860 RepID=UPI0031FB311F
MSNPYNDIFDSGEKEKTTPQAQNTNRTADSSLNFDTDNRFTTDGKEALDEVIENITIFQKQAIPFSELLTKVAAINHKVAKNPFSIFIVADDLHDQYSLEAEREYHILLQQKFNAIIVPMKVLAKMHLETVLKFNNEVGKEYYSVDKSNKTIKKEKELAIEGLNRQRIILANGASDLEILFDAIKNTEQRIKKYINAGGHNHISRAEYEVITQKTEALLHGYNHQFDYSVFAINTIDKAIIYLGFYMKQTTAQYTNKLRKAFL